MLQAVADAAAARGYALTVVTLGAHSDVAAAFERLREQGVDGVVVLNEATAAARDAPPRRARARRRRCAHPTPASRALRHRRSPTMPAAHARPTEHLLALGHRTVHHLAGPDGSFAAAERERGWREALTAAGRRCARGRARRLDRGIGSFGGAGARGDAEVTAVFAANDQTALGAMRAFAEAGRRVPDDVSVVGFDDVADAADYRPPLTTVRQDFDRLGELAVAALVSRHRGRRGRVRGRADVADRAREHRRPGLRRGDSTAGVITAVRVRGTLAE